MPVPKSAIDVRSLKGLTASASSARVLDLHALAADAPNDPDYADLPMFEHPVLNRTIIFKHNVRSSEEDPWAPRRFGSTKVVFGFDATDLNLGGQFLYVDQQDFLEVLTRHLDYRGFSLDRDVKVLRILDRLPTLDPFLIRESLSRQRIAVGRCYCRINAADKTEMLGFVSNEIEALIQLCFGDLEVNDRRTQRMSELLLADQDSPDLEPFRLTLRMDADQFSEAMFAWKAFLYYRWRRRTLAPQLKSTLRAMARIRPRHFERNAVAFAAGARRLVETTVASALEQVGLRLKRYDRAFKSLTDADSGDGFRNFLVQESGLFVELGERVGRLEQVVGFWNYRFSRERIGAMSPDDILDGMRDLLQALSLSTLDGAATPWPAQSPRQPLARPRATTAA